MNKQTKEAVVEIGTMAVVVVALCATIVFAIVYGTSRSEVVECNKWSQDAVGRPGYFLASWQDQQCRANGIIINVPVVK